MASLKDDLEQDRRIRTAVLAACILAHVVLLLWLARAPQPDDVGHGALQVEFIPATEAPQHTPPPPFPTAPQRPRSSRSVAAGRATPSAPPDPPVTTPSAPPALRSTPTTTQLMDAIQAAARADAQQAMPMPRDPTQRRAPRIPGRAESYTPNPIVLRRSISPEDILKAIGMLFGGNYHPCPDTQSKIRDLAARNERIGEDELQILIDRERRNCR